MTVNIGIPADNTKFDLAAPGVWLDWSQDCEKLTHTLIYKPALPIALRLRSSQIYDTRVETRDLRGTKIRRTLCIKYP